MARSVRAVDHLVSGTPAKPPHYLDVYRGLFIAKGIGSVIELGVHKGDSLRYWHSLGASRITGVDTDLSLVTDLPPTATVIHGDAGDPDVLAGLAAADLIVDDASHRWDHQQASFAALWPKARKAYVIEDIELAYSTDPAWTYGRSTAAWLGDRLRDLHTGNADWTRMTFHPGLVVFER